MIELDDKNKDSLFDDIEDKSYLEIYLDLKRQHHIIEDKLERLKSVAFHEAGKALQGETKGLVYGAHVEIRYRNVWQYSDNYETKKKELDALKKYEEKSGAAKLMEQTGYLSVSFKNTD